MLPAFATRLAQWIQEVPGRVGGRARSFGSRLELALNEGASLQQALEVSAPALGAAAVRRALEAEDGPAALVCVDLLRALDSELKTAVAHLGPVEQPWAQWTAGRLLDFAAALEDDVVHSHLVNAVLAEAAVTSELMPIEVRRISARALERRVVEVLLRMRSTVFTRQELVQTASTLGRARPQRRRLADA